MNVSDFWNGEFFTILAASLFYLALSTSLYQCALYSPDQKAIPLLVALIAGIAFAVHDIYYGWTDCAAGMASRHRHNGA
ncbi:MAG: hypothetical protein LBG43_01305 [Treponema sp.]|nr:hypothetical protein [Treponema sp.]